MTGQPPTTLTPTGLAVPSEAPTEAPSALPSRPALRALTVAAGAAYTVSWVVGLLVAPASTAVGSSGRQVLAGLAGHEAAATAQYLLTEGAPAVFLAIVALTLAGAARRTLPRAARAALATGLSAAGISLVQCVLGVYLTGAVAPKGDAGTAGTLTGWVDHLDGVKMLVLAGLALSAAALSGPRRVLPRWLAPTGWATAAALVVSGVGYLFTIGALSAAAYLSLPLLLILVTGTGIAPHRSERRGPATR
ncbi:hypothetical protein GCM10023322_82830 [Rugosimonospora acidiphila]|uniref:DUF4386 family protein n=1 Tax=Rugosimonospora acidiphila TaxID=556531 RepID=A0ABP9SSF5_9ACTN